MKGIITAIVIIAIALFAWSFFGGSEEAVEENTTPEVQNETGTETEESEVMDSEDTDVSSEGESMEEGAAEAKVFNLTGKNYEFSVAEMRVKEGDTVTVNFTTESGFHDWVVDEFDAATEQVSEEDGVTSITFVADQKGTFEYYCSVGSHRAQGMVGNLIVE